MKVLLVLASVCMLHAQDPMSKETKGLYTAVKGYILKSAEKMPESNYAFKPSPEVRNYGAILGHLAETLRKPDHLFANQRTRTSL
jgi:hypothetical protein